MPTAPQNQRLIKILGNEKDVGAVHLAYPTIRLWKNLYTRISNQLAHVRGLLRDTTHHNRYTYVYTTKVRDQ